MNWSERFAWWAVLRGKRVPRSDAPDSAEMGTAYGLDQSFDRIDLPEPLAPPAEPRPWSNRLIRRSGL